MKTLSLTGSDWTLTGYWQNQWRLRRADFPIYPAVASIPATVPGAVHADLLKAGIIADWQDGLNALRCEWVNNRDWSLRKTIHVPDDFIGRVALECDGLDYSGHVLVNSELVGSFEGTHRRHRFDLTGRVQAGQPFNLELIFDVAPQLDGVFGFTSRTRLFKPRFGYYWDWCTRLINVGIWQDLRLVCRGDVAFAHCRVLPRVNENLSSGSVRIVGQTSGGAAKLRYLLTGPEGAEVASGEADIRISAGGSGAGDSAAGLIDVTFSLDDVQLWWPATHGDQPLYQLELELCDANGVVSDRIERIIGFKRVRWLANPGAPEGTRPYLCEINGQQLFLRGINWVPLSPFYGLPTAEQYDAFAQQYRHMNANLLRVWGGGILERPEFYAACDRLGLLVWQEFPLSSSGIDNWPPEDPEVITQLERIAGEYIERRCHHACHLLWCGGNELQGSLDGSKVGVGKPVDESHPLMSRWGVLVEQLDPGKRFLASSPSGPRFFASPEEFGKGVNHHTHGPWGNLPLKDRYAYFNGDDTLFRTETGAPGCASLDALEQHRGDQSLWPPRPENLHWVTPAGPWVPWMDVTREFGPWPDQPASLPALVKASQYLQAESYRYAAEASRRRFPNCSAFVVWMGHDSVHCTANNSVIHIDGSTKPAYDWLRQAFAGRHVSLRHESIYYSPGSSLKGEIWVHRDEMARPAAGVIRARLRRLDGQVVVASEHPLQGLGGSIRVGTINWKIPSFAERLFVVELVWSDEAEAAVNRYLLSQEGEHFLAPLLSLPVATVEMKTDQPGCIRLRNTSATAALGVRLRRCVPHQPPLGDINNVILFPGEEQTIPCRGVQHGRTGDGPAPRLEWLNDARLWPEHLPAPVPA
ncbi:MAG: beta-mannosidase [Phycisphaerae bacterium]